MFSRIKLLYNKWKVKNEQEQEDCSIEALQKAFSVYLARSINAYTPLEGYKIEVRLTSPTADGFVDGLKATRLNLARNQLNIPKFYTSEPTKTTLEDWLRTNDGYRVSLEEFVEVATIELNKLDTQIEKFIEDSDIPETALSRKLWPLYDELGRLRNALLEFSSRRSNDN